MKRKYIIIASSFCAILLALIIACNIIIASVSSGKCYDNIDAIPHRSYGLLLGTGRSANPSPYYEPRLKATIDLHRAGKIDSVIVSGENLYEDYYEVDSMVVALKAAGVPIRLIDPYGTDTYTSLRRVAALDGTATSMTIISQDFHNQRAVFCGSLLYDEAPIAYNAQDTDIWYWDIWRLVRESLARTKAVIFYCLNTIVC